jgi:hypothetical protein
MNRRLLATAAVLAAVASLTGCGRDSSTAPRVTGTASSSGDATAQATLRHVMVGSVEAMHRKSTSAATVTIEAGGETVSAAQQVRFTQSGYDYDMTMSVPTPGGRQTVRLVAVGDETFAQLPGPQAVPGRPWRRIVPGSDDPVIRSMAASMEQTRGTSDPAYAMRLADAAGTLTGSAPDHVNGAEATRYSITIDMVRAAEAFREPNLHAGLQKQVDRGISSVAYDMWIDAEGLPLKVVMHVPVPASGMEARTVIEWRDWGRPVDIAAPPADQIAP